jgi:hypothetical protein
MRWDWWYSEKECYQIQFATTSKKSANAMFDFLKKQVSDIFYFYIEEEEIGKYRKRLKSRFEKGSTDSFHYFEPISKFAIGA